MTRQLTPLFLVLLFTLPASAQTLDVHIQTMPPMVVKTGSGFSGHDIDLIKAVGRKLGREVRFIEQDSMDALLGSAIRGEADMVIGGITINESREEHLDFSHRYFDSGLAVLVLARSTKAAPPSIWSAVFSWPAMRGFMYLFGFMVLCGVLYWFFERGKDNISDDPRKGILQGTWLAWAVMTTIGFGDVTPGKFLGRLLTVPIFFTGVMVLAVATSTLTVQQTVDTLNLDRVYAKPRDLQGQKVATVRGTTSVESLRDLGADATLTDNLEEATVLLKAGKVESVVFDAPAIWDMGFRDPEVTPVGQVFDRQYYGIAFPTDSPLREKVNIALLDLAESGKLGDIHSKWFGDNQ